MLPVREYLDKRYAWPFEPAEPALVTNSLQFLKHVLIGGKYIGIAKLFARNDFATS